MPQAPKSVQSHLGTPPRPAATSGEAVLLIPSSGSFGTSGTAHCFDSNSAIGGTQGTLTRRDPSAWDPTPLTGDYMGTENTLSINIWTAPSWIQTDLLQYSLGICFSFRPHYIQAVCMKSRDLSLSCASVHPSLLILGTVALWAVPYQLPRHCFQCLQCHCIHQSKTLQIPLSSEERSQQKLKESALLRAFFSSWINRRLRNRWIASKPKQVSRRLVGSTNQCILLHTLLKIYFFSSCYLLCSFSKPF